VSVVREALQLLKRGEETRALKMERLRQAIGDGDGAIARGDFIDIRTDEELDALFAEF